MRDRLGKEWVWALTSRFQNVMVNKIDSGNVNYRILRAPVDGLVKGTSCAPQRSQSYVTVVDYTSKPGYAPLIFT